MVGIIWISNHLPNGKDFTPTLGLFSTGLLLLTCKSFIIGCNCARSCFCLFPELLASYPGRCFLRQRAIVLLLCFLQVDSNSEVFVTLKSYLELIFLCERHKSSLSLSYVDIQFSHIHLLKSPPFL